VRRAIGNLIASIDDITSPAHQTHWDPFIILTQDHLFPKNGDAFLHTDIPQTFRSGHSLSSKFYRSYCSRNALMKPCEDPRRALVFLTSTNLSRRHI
jgi:hypothetical protein